MFISIIIHIETEKELFFIEASPIVRVSFFQPGKGLGVTIRIIPFKKEFVASGSQTKPKVETKKKKKKHSKPNWRKIRNAAIVSGKEFLQSFKVDVFSWRLDTGDYVLNAKIIPVFALVNASTGDNLHWQVNFQDENTLKLIVHNRVGRIAWIAIKTAFRIY